MAEPLKNLYSTDFYHQLSSQLNQVIPDFNSEQFQKEIFCSSWDKKELKDRMKHTADVLATLLPENFQDAAKNIYLLTEIAKTKQSKWDSFLYLFLADYIERFGINHFDIACKLIEKVTQLSSCEFAVRPFIIKYDKQMTDQMLLWSSHENYHVRRLATEGIRPRLPWAMALPLFKKDPSRILPILENLKNDPSEYVRKSVANNLNDITKDNPEIVLSLIKKWKNLSKETDWIIKHGTRTLLKQGNPDIITFYGLNQSNDITLNQFSIKTPIVSIGSSLNFEFELKNNDTKAHLVRLEYAIYYLRKNNTHSKKVFKISEKETPSLSKIIIKRKQSFKVISTRKFYPGTQKISIIINGLEKDILEFELIQ